MSFSKTVINRLLDKYEKSAHAKGGYSNRRVLLKTDKSDLPEYDYHNADTRDLFNSSVLELEAMGLVMKNWARKGYVLSEIWLNLDRIDEAYKFAGRKTPKELCDDVILLLMPLKEGCETAWIRDFAVSQIDEMLTKSRLTSLCRRDYSEIEDLVTAFHRYDMLRGSSVTMRAFSIGCYRDSKYFEKRVKDLFLVIARKYNADIADVEEHTELGWREQLMMMGIFARPELYELSGNIAFTFPSGNVSFSAFGSPGVALPDTLIGDILSIDMSNIQRVMFIENKTCYDEYIIKLMQSNELVFYQGGFISPKKARFIEKLKQYAKEGAVFYFWGDIDIGGFSMFLQLRKHIPGIEPWKMGADDFMKYRGSGMARSDSYIEKMEGLLRKPEFSAFHPVIAQLLLHRVTIEQESMLETLLQ